MNRPLVTFILATHNRRLVVVATLDRITQCGLNDDAYEVIVVDNASSDGTCAAIADRIPRVRVMARTDNLGSCAKGLAVPQAGAEFIVFLDDDSYPLAGSVERMLDHFREDERLGAAGFLTHLPDGRMECSALPNVFIGCGVGLRKSALLQVGGLDTGLFMQAEEYDLSFRLVNAGWGVETFTDLHVHHEKTTQARISERTTYYDTRNNLLLVERYLPSPFREIYRRDWMRRYRWLARMHGHEASFRRGMGDALYRAAGERAQYARHRLGPRALETLFRLEYVRQRMADLKRSGVRRVAFAELGKNVFAFHRAATDVGVSVQGVADDAFARVGHVYRGVPLIPTAALPTLEADALVISNTSPIHAEAAAERLARVIDLPIHRWFGLPTGRRAHSIWPVAPNYADSHVASAGSHVPPQG